MEVDRASVDAMARIMESLNNATAAAGEADDYDYDYPAPAYDDFGNEILEEGGNGIAPAVSTSSEDVDAMKMILERFHAAANSVEAETSYVAPRDPVLREALTTTPTSRGAQIGAWEIVKMAGSEPSYDVVNSGTGAPIATNLRLYDAALGLVRNLNEGVSITDPRVRDLLKLEEDFVRNRADAAGYRERAKKLREKSDDQRAAVAEDRFDEASRQAIEARDRILKLAGLL